MAAHDAPHADGRIRVTRSVHVPDPLRMARFAKAPEFGPKILFFSGGSAIGPLSRRLVDYTHNSIHLITPFDSGGSSAALREAFDMPAVGDLRNRLMALADHSVKGQPAIFDLFAHRFPHDESPEQLRQRLQQLIGGDDERMRRILNPMRKLIRNHLRYFDRHAEPDFDLRGASVGNLILVGGYLNNGRQIDPVIYLFSKLVEVRGTVRPIVGRSCHLAAELANGETLYGQHRITGKESPPIGSPIRRIFLVDNLDSPSEVSLEIRHKVAELIAEADLICYPMGSFYTSLIANLLPGGVASAIAANDCPKVFIPNTGADPEQFDVKVAESVRILLSYLRRVRNLAVSDLLSHVVLDSGGSAYAHPPDASAIRSVGVDTFQWPLVTDSSHPDIDPDRLLEVLLSLA